MSALLVCPLRLSFTALDPLTFPPSGAANTLRGAFGTLSRQLSPDDFYLRLFAPLAAPTHPSGFRQPPRPFVLRAAHLDAVQLAPGDPFHFGLPLFDTRDLPDTLAHLTAVFSSLLQAGLGPGRSRVRLESITGGDVITLPLVNAHPTTFESVTVEFLTPTELKANGVPVARPDFPVLFDRIRDRISALATFYGDGPLAFDWKELSAAAQRIHTDHLHLETVDRYRRSSRTGERHALSGFIGEARYSGDLARFLPWLHAAEWTGVGRQTVWGKGEIRISSQL